MKDPRLRLNQHLSEFASSARASAPGQTVASSSENASSRSKEAARSVLLEHGRPASQYIAIGIGTALACAFFLAIEISLVAFFGKHALEGDYAPPWLIWSSALLSVIVSAIVIERSLKLATNDGRTLGSKTFFWLAVFFLCLPITALLSYLQLIVVWAVVDWLNVFSRETPVSDRWMVALCTVGPAALGSAIFAMVAIAWKNLSAQNSFIELESDGILIGPASSRENQSACRFIRYEWIERVEYVKSLPIVAFGLGSKVKSQFRVKTRDKLIFQISKDDLARCYDPIAVVSVLQTKCPQALEGSNLTAAEECISDEPFTQLWLRYFSSSSNRVRKHFLEPGEIVCDGKFRIEKLLGSGGHANAYLATTLDLASAELRLSNDSLPLNIVLKEYILPSHRGERTMAFVAACLDREARLLSTLSHPGIVQIFDCFVEDGRGYLVLEYVEGPTVKELIERSGAIDEVAVIDIALQVCDILQYLHSLSPPVIHRDITPDNLILSAAGLVKLVDFNVAREVNSATVTALVGKQKYIPPEQFRGRPERRSDIYALGATMHFMLTAHEPEALQVSSPHLLNSTVSEAVGTAVAKATSQQSDERFFDATQMAQHLLRIKEELTRPS